MRLVSKGMVATAALAIAMSSTPASALSIVLRTDNSFTSSPNGAAASVRVPESCELLEPDHHDQHHADLRRALPRACRTGMSSARRSATVVDTSVRSVYQQLAATGNSALDAMDRCQSEATCPQRAGLAYRTPGADSSGNFTTTLAGSVLDNNDSYNNRFLNANTSIDKGLGIAFSQDDTLFGFLQDNGRAYNRDADADITFSSAFGFDFDPTNGVSVGTYDFIAVAIHEMGHALGFVSGTDDYDYYSGPNGPGKGSFSAKDADGFSWASTLDLFRFGANNALPDGTRDLQLDPNREAFFSIDGGRTPFTFGGTEQTTSNFSTGRYNGDGQQASHWKDTNGFTLSNGCYVADRAAGIMDPTFGSCALGIVTANDIAAMDAMGWNVNFDVLKNKTYAFNTAQAFNLFRVWRSPSRCLKRAPGCR